MTTTSREELLKVAQLVRPALANQTFIPALAHIRMSEGCADAYNDITAISVVLPKMTAELDVCLPGDLLVKTLSSFSTDEVLFKRGKNASLVLSSGRSNITIPTLPAKDFPLKWPTGKPLATLDLDDSIFKGLERCLLSVGSDAAHPAQMGVTLDVDDAGSAVLYSTDNFSISRYKAKAGNPLKLPGGQPIILPTFFVEQLLALSKHFQDEEVALLLYEGAVLAELGSKATLMTKLIADAEPLDFEKMITGYLDVSKIAKQHIEIPGGMEQALGRALLVMANSHDKFTEMACTDGELTLLSKSDLGVSEDALSLDEDDVPPFVVDPSMVLRALKSCTCMTMKKNVLVMSNADASFLHLVSHCSA